MRKAAAFFPVIMLALYLLGLGSTAEESVNTPSLSDPPAYAWLLSHSN